MENRKIIAVISFLVLLLGIAMVYLGTFYSPNLMLPPVISGFAFILIAWALFLFKDKT